MAMPLYHSAAMHVFLLPYLSLGATVRLLAAPDIPRMLELVETEHIGSLFLAPTVWVPLANHPDLATRDLSSLRKAQYGASIMPVTVLQRLRQSQPGIGFYNCFGQSELGPLCTVLRPEEHDARPASCGRPVFHVEARVMTADGVPAAPGDRQALPDVDEVRVGEVVCLRQSGDAGARARRDLAECVATLDRVGGAADEEQAPDREGGPAAGQAMAHGPTQDGRASAEGQGHDDLPSNDNRVVTLATTATASTARPPGGFASSRRVRTLAATTTVS